MLALKRKHLERGSRPTLFVVNARVTASEEVNRFLKRSKVSDQQVLTEDVPSPPGLQCFTPVPQTMDEESYGRPAEDLDVTFELPSNKATLVQRETRTDLSKLSVDRFVRNSDTWHVAEYMAHDLGDYVSGALESGLWVDSGISLDCISATATAATSLTKFHEFFNEACNAFTVGESQRAWSNIQLGFDLLEDLTLQQHVQFLARLCEIVCILHTTGHNRIAKLLVQQFAEMSLRCLKGSALWHEYCPISTS